MTFNETGLHENVLRAITEMGFVNPTPIQEKTIPQILESKNDLVALAQTGTGKTAAFGLPVIQLTELQDKNVQTLVLCPTRELGLQITKDIQTFTQIYSRFQSGSGIWWSSYLKSDQGLKKGSPYRGWYTRADTGSNQTKSFKTR
jgi:superfamily II DNA/RNA helicase